MTQGAPQPRRPLRQGSRGAPSPPFLSWAHGEPFSPRCTLPPRSICVSRAGAQLPSHAFNSPSLAVFSLRKRYLMSAFELITRIGLPLNGSKRGEKRVSEKRPERYHGEHVLLPAGRGCAAASGSESRKPPKPTCRIQPPPRSGGPGRGGPPGQAEPPRRWVVLFLLFLIRIIGTSF